MPNFTRETSEVAFRFHRDNEWYIQARDGDLFVLRVHATSERAVELFHRLTAHLDPSVDVVVEHRRDATSWLGALQDLAQVREAIGRLRWPLASSGGVEFTLVTPDDQITLMPSLELVIYSRRDHWSVRLADEGVRARVTAPPAVWHSGHVPWSPAPDLTVALSAFAERLALELAT